MSIPLEPSVGPAVADIFRPLAGAGAFDEVFEAGGNPRAHWRGLLQAMGHLGPVGFGDRAEDGRRILREHGVSVPVPGGPAGVERPWELDFLPLMLSAAEWRVLEVGLLQRVRLLNAILQDLHGKLRLARHGFLPAALIFANPGYLRACQAIRVPGGVYLHTYAADLARSPDGQWWVLADWTQAPAGLGFAQESRTVMSRVLPEAVQEVRPRSLADTWRSREAELRNVGAGQTGEPVVVLLTPGPGHEAWFEHAYLSRLLGFTLVESEDLTVRDRRVFMKTLDGLRQVDVILRRVADAFCDPLELRSDSLVGVPGLVEAARAGHVGVVNALGAGLVEGPAFLPFLPGLCRHVLGEDLRLPSVATWWCGQAREMAYTTEHAAELVLRPAFALSQPGQARDPATLLAAMRQRPHDYVGQEQVRLSRVPAAVERHWEARPFVLRLFVVRDGDDYSVVPGGLARLVDFEQTASLALSLAGPCKDVWVLSESSGSGETQHVVVPPPLPRERAPSQLPSRTADNFFWLGRYAERLEQLARLARCAVRRLADDTEPGSDRQMEALGRLLTRLDLFPAASAWSLTREGLQKELLLFVHKEGRSPGVRELLHHIHMVAFAVRYRLSADTWRILNRLDPDARQRPARLPLLMAASVLNNLILDLAAFSGMETENMTRGNAWVFLEIGRRLERGYRMTRLLSVLLDGGDDVAFLLEPVLEVADSVMTHRWRYFDQPRPEGVLELLLHDSTNPRSVAFQVARIESLASRLPAGINPEGASHVRRRIAALSQAVGGPQADAGSGEDARALLQTLGMELGSVSDLLSQVYFSQVPLRLS